MLDTVSNETPQVAGGARHGVDASELPEWGRAGDGAFVRLVADTDLQSDFAAWQSEACSHPQQFTGKSVNAGGVEVFKRYCRTCGIATTQQLPHRTIQGTTVTLIDGAKREKLIDQYINDRREGLEEIVARAADRMQPDRRADYAKYLNSAEWREKRDAVIDRCGGVCEGCRKQSASDVHHLSYRNIHREFLFELVGLCRDCHERWHEQSQ